MGYGTGVTDFLSLYMCCIEFVLDTIIGVLL